MGTTGDQKDAAFRFYHQGLFRHKYAFIFTRNFAGNRYPGVYFLKISGFNQYAIQCFDTFSESVSESRTREYFQTISLFQQFPQSAGVIPVIM